MEKYYIAAWIFGLSFLGMGSIIIDMIYNSENDYDDSISFYTNKPEIKLNSILDEYDDVKDSFDDNQLKNVEENYFSDSDLGI